MKQNVPFAPQRYFDLSGLPADGGYLWIYQKGTSTPATSAIWFDADGLVAGTNPVLLDGAGQPQPTGAFYLNSGAYTLVLFGADDVQIGPPVDIVVFGSAFGSSSEIINQGNAIICKTYNDVRGLAQAWDIVYACGRVADGDGGEGWFQLVPTETGADDDGICLVAGTNRYIRVFDSVIDPRWYGLVYGGATDQWPKIAIVGAASARWSKPAQISGQVYLGQGGTIASGWSFRCDAAGGFVSATGLPIALVFADGCEFDSVGVCFSPEVNPTFNLGAVPVVPLSWMGGVDGDQRLAKWAACSSSEQEILLDDQVTTSTLPTFPATMHMDVAPGSGKITVSATANLSVDVVYQGDEQWLSWGIASNIGSVYVGPRPCRPEWFGAVGDNTTDDGIPLRAAAKSGDILAGYNKSYRTAIQVSTTPFTVRGDTTAPLTAPTLNDVTDPPNPRIFMDPAASTDMVSLLVAGKVAFLGANLSMSSNASLNTNSGTFAMIGGAVFASSGKVKSSTVLVQDSAVSALDIFTATTANQYLSNVRDDTEPTKRKYRNSSSFQDVYLENEKKTTAYTKILTVDTNGKIVSAEDLGQIGDVSVIGDLHVGGNFTLNFARTLIEFTAGNVYRNGVSLGAGTYYDIQTGDHPIIAVINNNVSTVCQIRPANLPSGSYKIDVVNIGPYRVDVGDVSGSTYCWLSAYPVKLPDTTYTNGKMGTTGWNINGKWSFS